MLNRRTLQFSFLGLLFVVALVLSFFIFKPYLNVLVLAGVFAIIFYPLYNKITNFWDQKFPSIAAFLTVLIAAIIIFAPLSFLGARVFTEASDIYDQLTENTINEQPPIGIIPSDNPVLRNIQEKFNGAITSLLENVRGLFDLILQNVSRFFGSVANLGLSLFLWFLSFYYFLRDGHKIRELLIHFSPLSDQYDKEIMRSIVKSIKSVVGGSLIVALIQGILAGVGLWFFGVPNPTIWGLVAVIAALVPTIGTAIVMTPAVIYLFLTNATVPAIGLLVWSFLIVGGIDNILRPKLIERGSGLHPLAILLAVLGGIVLFGPVGFLTGPIVITLLVELIRVYREMSVPEGNASNP